MIEKEQAIEEILDSQAPYIMQEILLKDIENVITDKIKEYTYGTIHSEFYKATLNKIIEFCNTQISKVNETT